MKDNNIMQKYVNYVPLPLPPSPLKRIYFVRTLTLIFIP